MNQDEKDQQARRGWMSLLAKSAPRRLDALLAEAVRDQTNASKPSTAFTWLRPPEVGSVMVQGRTGGTGARFNLGEMTVTRCALRSGGGEVGHAYVQGRDKAHAERAALVDALMQTEAADLLRTRVIEPLAADRAAATTARAAKAAATKVEFFTMVRGED